MKREKKIAKGFCVKKLFS